MRNAVRWSREGLRRTREGLRRNGCGPPLAILGALSILTRVSILQNSSGQRDLIIFGHESELWFLSKIKQAPLKIRLQIEAKYHAASNRQPCRVIDRCPVSAGCNWQETRLERTAGNVPARFRKIDRYVCRVARLAKNGTPNLGIGPQECSCRRWCPW